MANIIIGSRALQEYTRPLRPCSDIDLILDELGLSELPGYQLISTGIPGKFLGIGEFKLEITRWGKKSHHLLLNHISHSIEFEGITLAVPTLSALRAIKKGAVQGGINAAKSRDDLAFIDTLEGWIENEQTDLLVDAIYREALSNRTP